MNTVELLSVALCTGQHAVVYVALRDTILNDNPGWHSPASLAAEKFYAPGPGVRLEVAEGTNYMPVIKAERRRSGSAPRQTRFPSQ
jgi:hypothetical protein